MKLFRIFFTVIAVKPGTGIRAVICFRKGYRLGDQRTIAGCIGILPEYNNRYDYKQQGEFSLGLKAGGYELIISYTGYQTRTIRISSNEAVKMDIEMAKEDKSMGEVVIKSSNEVPDGWQKYGSFFLDNFIGTTPNAAKCILQNPEVLKFYFLKKSNKLRVLATEPLVIKNKHWDIVMRGS